MIGKAFTFFLKEGVEVTSIVPFSFYLLLNKKWCDFFFLSYNNYFAVFPQSTALKACPSNKKKKDKPHKDFCNTLESFIIELPYSNCQFYEGWEILLTIRILKSQSLLRINFELLFTSNIKGSSFHFLHVVFLNLFLNLFFMSCI